MNLPVKEKGTGYFFETAKGSGEKSSLSPFALGYRMPAEWKPHEATWLSWPHNEETWPGKVAEIEEVYLQMIEALTGQEKIRLLVNDERERDKVSKRIRARVPGEKNVIYELIPTVDSWIRDYGPAFVQKKVEGRKKIAGVRWLFNAWGGKYESLAKDNEVGERLMGLLKIPFYEPGLILEGGSIDANGLGTCLVTEQCLLNPNRNPHLSRSGIEKALHDFLGFTHWIWLGEGIEGDDTDGHIDDIARFVNSTTVVAAVEKDLTDRNHTPLQENLRRLHAAQDQRGNPLTVAEMPMPDRVEASGGRLPASYLNFYIANGVVLVPIFGQAKDAVALKILGELFPKRKIIGIRSEDLVLGLGAIHCVTHEQPSAP